MAKPTVGGERDGPRNTKGWERFVPPTTNAAGGMPIVAEYFDREDDRFVGALREIYLGSSLAAFVDRWKLDSRPWARRQVLAYLDHPLNVPGHHVVVKRLFKQAEERRDHEQMAAFLVAFDRLIRRIRKTRLDLTGDELREVEYLGAKRDVIWLKAGEFLDRLILTDAQRRRVDPAQAAWRASQLAEQIQRYSKNRLFSYRTRRYLQRRAWRYFRRLGLRHPAEYVAGVADGLLRYVDDDFARPEHLLDSWGFVHACFGKHAAIEFASYAAAIRPGRSAAELTAAPYFEPLWAEPGAAAVLWRLLFEARSRAVRLWARQLLERLHGESLRKLSVETLRRLLAHDDAELQQFGALLLAQMPGIESWPVDTWLQLLELRDPTALTIVCELLGKSVSGERLDVPQTLALATARSLPVARLGLKFLRGRRWDSPDDRRRLTTLGTARCDAAAVELANFALGVVGEAERYDREVIVALFDSLQEPMRAATSAWFAGSAVAQDDPVLWSRLIETPFDDVRLPIVDLLQQRSARPRIDGRDLAPLWSSVLLAVHRGGRRKLKAVDQLVSAVVDDPRRAEALVPVLGTAVRSIRGPEQRAGLAGVARLLELRPELAAIVGTHLPEIQWAT